LHRIFICGENRFDLCLAHFTEMLQRGHFARRRFVQHEEDVLAVGPLFHFTFDDLGKMRGRDVLHGIVLIYDNRHVVRETGGQGKCYPNSQTENPFALHSPAPLRPKGTACGLEILVKKLSKVTGVTIRATGIQALDSGRVSESHDVVAAIHVDDFASNTGAGIRGEEHACATDFGYIDITL
jgi:hypothetical protein